MHVHVFVGVHAMCVQVPAGSRWEGRTPGTGVTGGGEPPGGLWKLNLGPLQEQEVLLDAEASLLFPDWHLYACAFLCFRPAQIW